MSLYIYSLGRPELLATCIWPIQIADAIEVVAHGALAAVVRPITVLSAPVRRTDLEHHDAVNRAVLATGLCVPMRWGTIVDDHAACLRLLEEQSDRWLRIAQRLRGRVELSATIVLATAATTTEAAPVAVESQPGTSYLRMRQAEYTAEMARTQQARDLEAVLRTALDDSADTVVVAHRGRLMTVAALVPHEQFDVAAKRVRNILTNQAGRWSIGAPWPPYSFTGEEHATATTALQDLLL